MRSARCDLLALSCSNQCSWKVLPVKEVVRRMGKTQVSISGQHGAQLVITLVQPWRFKIHCWSTITCGWGWLEVDSANAGVE